LQIRGSVEEVSTAVAGLSRVAADNAASVSQMAASTSEIDKLVEQLLRSVELVSDSIHRMSAGQLEVNDSVNHLLETSSSTVLLVAEMDDSVHQIEQSRPDHGPYFVRRAARRRTGQRLRGKYHQRHRPDPHRIPHRSAGH